MKRATRVRTTVSDRGEDKNVTVGQLAAIAQRMAKAAPESDGRCSLCRDANYYYVDPADPDKGVRKCTRPACVKRRRDEAAKQRPVVEPPQRKFLDRAEGRRG